MNFFCRALLFILTVSAFSNPIQADERKPNFILIFTDDQGYNDLGCFGSPNIKTPRVDQMAAEGIRFTSFYSGAAICTPSRAALLTGCYPDRVGGLPVLFPRSDRGLNPKEITIAEILKTQGYATACFGKWHLGHHKPFLPTAQGFDEYIGIPYSNDMGVDADMDVSENVIWRDGASLKKFRNGGLKGKNPPLLRDTKVIEYPVDQTLLTRRYTAETLRFIKEKKDEPFFIYLPVTMPHVPLYVSNEFRGTSNAGLYGDAIEEIDWAVGEIIDQLRKLDLAEDTMIVFSSDNGPWHLKGSEKSKVKGNTNRGVGGSAFPLRGHKYQFWEGGVREPCVMWWPGKIPAGKTTGEIAGTIDLLPTFAELAGASLGETAPIDGKSIVPLIESQEGARSPHKAWFYGTKGVRKGNWKLLGGELFDLEADISETTDLSKKLPEVVADLTRLLGHHRSDLGRNSRPPGTFKRKKRTFTELPGWEIEKGLWTVIDDVLHQSFDGATSIFSPKLEATEYTLEVEGRVTKGSDGFRIMVMAPDHENYVRLSIGSFGNRKHSLMLVQSADVEQRRQPFKGKIKNDVWYRVKIEIGGDRIRCFLNDKVIHDEPLEGEPVAGSIGLGSFKSEVEFRNLRVLSKAGETIFESLRSSPIGFSNTPY